MKINKGDVVRFKFADNAGYYDTDELYTIRKSYFEDNSWFVDLDRAPLIFDGRNAETANRWSLERFNLQFRAGCGTALPRIKERNV